MNYTISPISENDQEAAKTLIMDGLADFGFSYNKTLDVDLDDPRSFYIDQCGIFYVLKVNNQVVGTVAVINKGNHIAELKRLYVTKDYQGQGLGSALLDKAIAFAKEKGCKKVEFETNKKFIKAHILYQKKGFHVVKEDEDSFYMEKMV